ncbi:MAG: hypothetical protein BWY14_00023 [Parcubacteria group bacterium ADurb.Bin192]|nr:MAG: hypothetical protein BWY14_00023 [Parcubacteria group bacterium ADurb.Bin192]
MTLSLDASPLTTREFASKLKPNSPLTKEKDFEQAASQDSVLAGGFVLFGRYRGERDGQLPTQAVGRRPPAG